MKLIVGLGNPDKAYAHNRHNTGFRCINHLARLHSTKPKRSQCQSRLSAGRIAGIEVLLAKPRTFVNLSGEAISQLMRKYRIPVDELIVICDDLDLPLGKLRLRQGGGAGGHNGLKSIIDSLGNEDFCRIRIGISRPLAEQDTAPDKTDIISYVLGDFTREEEKIIEPAIARAAEAIECILTQGITTAMSRYN